MSAILPRSIAWMIEPSNFDGVRAAPRESISADASVSSRWIARDNDLKTIRRYRDDWDGMGADALDPRVVDNAIRFLGKLRREKHDLGAPDTVLASPTGTVVLVWNSNGTYIEAEIAEMWRVDWMLESPSGTQHVSQDWTDMDESSAIPQGAVWSESHPISSEPGRLSSVG